MFSKAINDMVEKQKDYWSNIAYSSDGKLVAFITKDSMINIREMDSGMLCFQKPAPIGEVTFSPHGDEIAYGDKKICIWNISSDQLVRTFNNSSSSKLITYSNNGAQLAVINEGKIAIYDIASGEIINVLRPTKKTISSLVFGKDDKSLLISYMDTIYVIEISSGKILNRGVLYEQCLL